MIRKSIISLFRDIESDILKSRLRRLGWVRKRSLSVPSPGYNYGRQILCLSRSPGTVGTHSNVSVCVRSVERLRAGGSRGRGKGRSRALGLTSQAKPRPRSCRDGCSSGVTTGPSLPDSRPGLHAGPHKCDVRRGLGVAMYLLDPPVRRNDAPSTTPTSALGSASTHRAGTYVVIFWTHWQSWDT